MSETQYQLIEQTPLKNAATLELYDTARTMIGDRMLVSLTARVKIPVESLYQHPAAPELPPADPLRALLGDPVTWEHVKQRHFIDTRKKPEVLERLLAEFNTHMRAYLTHPDFPVKYVQKQLREHQKRNAYIGIWKDRTDLPDFKKIRSEWDRD